MNVLYGLIKVAEQIGTVTSVNMYENGYMSIEGKTEDGKKFSITRIIEKEEKKDD